MSITAAGLLEGGANELVYREHCMKVPGAGVIIFKDYSPLHKSGPEA